MAGPTEGDCGAATQIRDTAAQYLHQLRKGERVAQTVALVRRAARECRKWKRGQWRARRHGIAGIRGIPGNVDSVTYRI
jgi:hypothetical protein